MAEDTHEERQVAYEAEVRAKYTADDLKDLQAAGKAMPPSKDGDDPSYPISDQEDLEKAIKAVGRGNADHDAIRLHIITQAEKLGLTKLIPDNWNMTSGSMKQANSAIPRRAKKPRHRSGPAVGVEVRRFAAEGLEVRSGANGTDSIEIKGAPIVYNVPYAVRDMFGEFQETMAPGVATSLLPTVDCRFLFNHDGLPLARTLSGTLALEDSSTSLNFSAQLDARQGLANDLAIAIERGDVSQMSVGFIVADDRWNPAETERTIYRLQDLLDVSAVTYPASPTTSISVAARMMEQVPVESRARVRRMWAITRDLREGRSVDSDAIQTLAAGLAALAEADDEQRDTPTAVDKKMPKVLADAHSAVHAALQKQMTDPDNGSDPDDDEVMGHIKNALSSLVKAQVAQGVDGTPDAEDRVDPEANDDASSYEEDPDGTQGEPDESAPGAQDGTGSRADAHAAELRRTQLLAELELAKLRRTA